SEIAFETENCGKVRGIKLDGVLYTAASPIPLDQVDEIEIFVDNSIADHGSVGSTEVFYQNYFGVREDFHISIMQTDLESAVLVFGNCQYDLATKECCEIFIVDQEGEFPIPQSPGQPDLFFEKITYDGLDISMIEMMGGCKAGLIRNQYSYDADHRLK